jgi:hypothetical protein
MWRLWIAFFSDLSQVFENKRNAQSMEKRDKIRLGERLGRKTVLVVYGAYARGLCNSCRGTQIRQALHGVDCRREWE